MDIKALTKRARAYMDDTKKLIEMDMPGPALMSCRNALESLVKTLCKEGGLSYDSRETDLSAMIDALHETGIVDTYIKDLLHRVRMTCNKGAHIDSVVTSGDAAEALRDITEAYEKISGSVSRSSLKQIEVVNNVPKPNPDYYSSSRKYYGKWAHCYDKASLMVIPEYVELLKSVQSDYDVEAMLDIAVGFLPPEGIVWSSDGLVNMPNYINRGQVYNQDKAYDERYYYWIRSALACASLKKDSFPRKYIATAIWEGILHWFSDCVNPEFCYCVTGVEDQFDTNTGQYLHYPIYTDQRLIKDRMIDPAIVTEDHLAGLGRWEEIMTLEQEIFKGLDKCDYVAPIHEDARTNPYIKLRFLTYCVRALGNTILGPRDTLSAMDAADINEHYEYLGRIQNTEITQRVHEGDPVTWDMVKPYTVGQFCNTHYNMARTYEAKYLAENSNPSGSQGAFSSFIKGIFG